MVRKPFFSAAAAVCAWTLVAAAAQATPPRLDGETCNQLRQEQAKFLQSGILQDIERGPEWARTNLAAERIREIELFLQLDEQVKFGCRDARMSEDVERAAAAARTLETRGADAEPQAAGAGDEPDGSDAKGAPVKPEAGKPDTGKHDAAKHDAGSKPEAAKKPAHPSGAAGGAANPAASDAGPSSAAGSGSATASGAGGASSAAPAKPAH